MQRPPAGADTKMKGPKNLIMATQRQIEANRRNAQKSTGPKTPEGCEIVSRNALTHGLTAARAVVLPEEEEEFDRFATTMRGEWDAQGLLERFFPDRFIQCAWRLERVRRVETGVLLALRQKEAVVTAQDEPLLLDPAMLGRAYIEGNGVLTRLSRYERQLERSLREAQRELELAIYARHMQVNIFYARNLRKFPRPARFADRKRTTSTGKQANRDPTECRQHTRRRGFSASRERPRGETLGLRWRKPSSREEIPVSAKQTQF